MREGKLLAEEPPQQLMEKCCCSDLEEAFLKLSHKQEIVMRRQVSGLCKVSVLSNLNAKQND